MIKVLFIFEGITSTRVLITQPGTIYPMQPHSMCAVALANYMWNRPERRLVKSCYMDVEYYTTDGKYKLNKYDLTHIEESDDRRTLKVYIMRSGGGISCQITLMRSSVEEGGEITMTHSQNHVSGLREVYKLYKNKLQNGMHYNSERYRNFKGESYHPERKTFHLESEVRIKNDIFVWKTYDLRIISLNYK